MLSKLLRYPYILWMVVFILLPLLLIIYYAFTSDISGQLVFSLDNIIKTFDPIYVDVLVRSIILALICTAICLVLGYPVALYMARNGKKAQRLMIWFMLPMWMNFLLRTYAWMMLLDTNGLINQLLMGLGFGRAELMYNSGAILVGMVYNFLPFMVLPIYTALSKIPNSLVEAAEDLGANSRRVFSRIIFPLSMPGVISGITMVFMPAITTFAISRLLGGSQYMLYGDLIENQFLTLQDWNFGSALSFIMMLFIIVSMLVLSRHDQLEQAGGGL
ncbi:MAG: ABC transporter permease [Christensenellales bacterium]|jgi:spermidine/putrescine transport system permease protein